MSNLSSIIDTENVTEVEEKSTMQPEVIHDDDDDDVEPLERADECDAVRTDDVIDVDVCAGLAAGTDRTDVVVNEVNLCHTVDETATWLRRVE